MSWHYRYKHKVKENLMVSYLRTVIRVDGHVNSAGFDI